MWIIAERELRSLFSGLMGWSMLAVVQFILGWVFAVLVYVFTQPDIQAQLATQSNAPSVSELILEPWFNWVGMMLLLITPLLTMRLISEERRNHTLPLLIASPIPIRSIVLGKFFGVMGFFSLSLLLLSSMPLSLLIGTALDLQHLAAALLGVFLLTAAFSAIGLYLSTLSPQPVVAAVSTFGILLLLWMLDWAGSQGEANNVLNYLSLLTHYQVLVQGLVSSVDVFYYLLLTALFLVLSIHRLDLERLH